MGRVLPLLVAVLALHASTVTLEGVLLVQRELPFLCWLYAAIGATVALAQRAIQRAPSAGLMPIWLVCVGFQAVRVVAFSWRAGLLRRAAPAAAATRPPQ